MPMNESQPKKPYRAPKLRVYGPMVQLTRFFFVGAGLDKIGWFKWQKKKS